MKYQYKVKLYVVKILQSCHHYNMNIYSYETHEGIGAASFYIKASQLRSFHIKLYLYKTKGTSY